MYLNTTSSCRLLTIKDIFLCILSFSKVYAITSFNIFEFYTRTVSSGGVGDGGGSGGSAGNKKEGD